MGDNSSIVVPSLYSRFDDLVLYYAVPIFLCAAEPLSGSFFSVATVDTAVDTAVGTAVGTAGLINGIVPVHDVARFSFVRGVCLVCPLEVTPSVKLFFWYVVSHAGLYKSAVALWSIRIWCPQQYFPYWSICLKGIF